MNSAPFFPGLNELCTCRHRLHINSICDKANSLCAVTCAIAGKQLVFISSCRNILHTAYLSSIQDSICSLFCCLLFVHMLSLTNRRLYVHNDCIHICIGHSYALARLAGWSIHCWVILAKCVMRFKKSCWLEEKKGPRSHLSQNHFVCENQHK